VLGWVALHVQVMAAFARRRRQHGWKWIASGLEIHFSVQMVFAQVFAEAIGLGGTSFEPTATLMLIHMSAAVNIIKRCNICTRPFILMEINLIISFSNLTWVAVPMCMEG
jgi:hypothetical protein